VAGAKQPHLDVHQPPLVAFFDKLTLHERLGETGGDKADETA